MVSGPFGPNRPKWYRQEIPNRKAVRPDTVYHKMDPKKLHLRSTLLMDNFSAYESAFKELAALSLGESVQPLHNQELIKEVERGLQ